MSIVTWRMSNEEKLSELLKLSANDIKHRMFTVMQLHCAAGLWGIGFHEAEQRLSKGELPCLKPDEVILDLELL